MRIQGSAQLVRGGIPVVSMTECSPLEVRALLKHQSEQEHGEPFKWGRSRHGVAVRRNAAIARGGAMPVLAGDAALWASLSPANRFRFVRWEPPRVDWTFEREFRVLGNLDLQLFQPTDVVLIVENRHERFRLLAQRDVTPFPVMPFDYVFSTDDPYPRRTKRQQAALAQVMEQ